VSADAVIEAERLRVSLARRAQRLVSRERRAELAVGGCFLLAAAALALLAPRMGHLELGLAVAYVACAAAATQVRFDIGGGITVPTQVVFVPMLLAVPAALTPLLLMMAWALGMLPAVLTGRLAASRLLTAPATAGSRSVPPSCSSSPAIPLQLAVRVCWRWLSPRNSPVTSCRISCESACEEGRAPGS